MLIMEEKYGKLNENFREKKSNPHTIKDEKTTESNVHPRF